jgi:hypothetical protein
VFPQSSMAPKAAKQYGPKFLRHWLVSLSKLETDDPVTDWRCACESRVQELTTAFEGGEFGLTVTCGVQILEKESIAGNELIDDGVSTLQALKQCFKHYQDDQEVTPAGEAWSESLASIFLKGLAVRVVAYSDDDDREAREAWNIAKHDEESNTVRWSTLHQKVQTALGRFHRAGCWSIATESLLDLYGPGKKSSVGRWVRAAKGLGPEIVQSLKNFPDMKGAYLWDTPISSRQPAQRG